MVCQCAGQVSRGYPEAGGLGLGLGLGLGSGLTLQARSPEAGGGYVISTVMQTGSGLSLARPGGHTLTRDDMRAGMAHLWINLHRLVDCAP